MNELALKYGCNPNQKPSRIYMEDGSDLPVTVLNGKPGYINFLDALNSIQLVKELKAACGLPAAASFKHVSPAGAALGLPLTDVERKMYHIAPDMELSPLANAYARARGADRMSSFGDWIALSDICDVPTAKLIQHEVSDGIIAPGYEPEALAILSGKKKGNYNVVAIAPAYKPAPIEHKQVYGITFEQGRNELVINADTMLNNWVTENKTVTEEQKLVFTTIPYDAGWNVYVDGKKVETYRTLSALLSFEVEEGYHTLEFRYMPKCYVVGFMASAVGILLFAFFIIITKVKKVRNKVFAKASFLGDFIDASDKPEKETATCDCAGQSTAECGDAQTEEAKSSAGTESFPELTADVQNDAEEENVDIG